MKGVWWCTKCQVPLLSPKCDICGFVAAKPFAKDLTPVFAEEMTLLRDTIGFTGLPKKSRDFYLWNSGLNYYCCGQKIATLHYDSNADPTIQVYTGIPKAESRPPRGLTETLKRITKANRTHIDRIVQETENFLRSTINKYPKYIPVVPFSGGKDSLVVSILTRRVIPATELLHVFSDTGIESSDTIAFVEHFQKVNPQIPLVRVVPNVNFWDMCRLLGPPSRIKRWCCSTQKAFPLGTLYSTISLTGRVMSLCGVRRSESTARHKHEQILFNTKISDEMMVCPIIDWTNIEIWIYLLSIKQEINNAYRRGFKRIGCIHCPYNSLWSDFLKKRYYPYEAKRWNDFVDSYYSSRLPLDTQIPGHRRWKTRAGGLSPKDDLASLEVKPCTNDTNAFSVKYNKKVSKDFWEYLRPFGEVRILYDDGVIGQAIILSQDKTVLFEVQVSKSDQVRFVLHQQNNQRLLSQRIIRQVRKALACVHCGVCQLTCHQKAITANGRYVVDPLLCNHCLKCVTNIHGGCVAAHSTNVTGRR